MKIVYELCLLLIITLLIGACSKAEKNTSSIPNSIFKYQRIEPRWSTPENINGTKGAGGKENNGAKGRPSVSINAGETFDLLNIHERGFISRMWITIDDRSPEMLRSLKLEMFWDDETKPAVSVPFGDFFSVGLGRTATFENEFFANPEGRSFNCFIPMPFKKGAKISVTNESSRQLNAMFFDVDFQLIEDWSDDYLYFHAYWSRDTATTLAEDFELLPKVIGRGRFLGVNIGINSNPLYDGTWWGEGEVKIRTNGDSDWPTLVGTGTEDYIGTAWGQGQYVNRYTGCVIGSDESRQWAFYRYHVPDPIFFETDCRISIQQMGGAPFEKAKELQNSRVPMIPVTIINDKINYVYDPSKVVDLDDPSLPNGWTNFYRSDDVSATVYFYLDGPRNQLPSLADISLRTYNLQSDKSAN